MCPWYCSCTHIHSSVWLCCFLQHRNRKHAATDGKSPPGAWPKLLGVKRCLHLCWTKTTQSNKNPLRAGTPVTIKSSVTQAPSITHSFCGEWAISLLQLKLQLWELSPGEVCASVNMPADVLFIWIKHLEPTSVTMARESEPLGSKKVPKLYTKWNHISAAFIFATATCKFIFADKLFFHLVFIYQDAKSKVLHSLVTWGETHTVVRSWCISPDIMQVLVILAFSCTGCCTFLSIVSSDELIKLMLGDSCQHTLCSFFCLSCIRHGCGMFL